MLHYNTIIYDLIYLCQTLPVVHNNSTGTIKIVHAIESTIVSVIVDVVQGLVSYASVIDQNKR